MRKDLNGHAVRWTWERIDRSDLGNQEEKKHVFPVYFFKYDMLLQNN